ncbi:MAG: VPLPA-CTERM sorting domain-containing protein, partial [Paracoccaceae bacterium]
KCRDKDHRVDGSGTNDLAIFSFGSALSVTSVSFSNFDSVIIPAKYEKRNTTCKRYKGAKCKEWNFEYVLVTPSETVVDMFDLFLGSSYASTGMVASTVSFAGLPSVFSFGIGASGIYDGFKIVSLTAEHVPPPSPVPLPAGGLLLLSALGGVAAIKRRQKSA